MCHLRRRASRAIAVVVARACRGSSSCRYGNEHPHACCRPKAPLFRRLSPLWRGHLTAPARAKWRVPGPQPGAVTVGAHLVGSRRHHHTSASSPKALLHCHFHPSGMNKREPGALKRRRLLPVGVAGPGTPRGSPLWVSAKQLPASPQPPEAANPSSRPRPSSAPNSDALPPCA